MPPKPASSNPYSGIKQYLTAEACSASTLKLLNEAFSALESTITAATLKVSVRPKSAKPASKNIAAAETVSSASKALERYKLAIDVINTCLKALGDAAKKDTPPASVTTLEGPAPAWKTATKPLQSRSANRNDTRPDSIVNLALCCALSISYLNSIQHASNIPELPPLQVETAQNTLVLKLIQLGMFEMGLKEARSLKRKLGEHMQNNVDVRGDETKVPKAKGSLKSTSTKVRAIGKENAAMAAKPEKESFSKILEFKQVVTSELAFPLVISCQLGILRCLVGMKRPELIDAILPSLSTRYNPLSLVQTLSESSPSKALVQLNVLTHTLLSAVPSTSISADSSATDPKMGCSPRTALTLQTMATKCAFLRKTLQPGSKETRDDDLAEQWENWRKYLTAYVRRTQDQRSRNDRYIFIKGSVDTVREQLYGNHSSKSLPLEILRVLATVSFEAGLLKEAISCTEEWLMELETTNSDSDVALKLIGNVRLATIELKLSTISKDGKIVLDSEVVEGVKERVEIAVEGLAAIRTGRKGDLEFLLSEVASLRRSGVSLLAALLKDGNESEETETEDDKDARWTLRRLCDSIFRGVIRFCGKYLAMIIPAEERAKATKLVTSTAEMAVSTAWRGFGTDTAEAWDSVEDLIRESLSIIRSLPDDQVDQAMFYEKISTTYWQIYLVYRKAGLDKASILALTKSAITLDGRPAVELRANAATRWERLGNTFVVAGDWRRAEDALLSALNVFFETGVLEELGQSATRGELIGGAFDIPNKEAMVGRVLAGLVKCAIKNGDGVASSLRFDYKGISKASRGILLEWSMKLAIGTMGSDGEVARILAERLLDVYSFEEMPLRRSRVISKLLGLAVDHAELFNKKAVTELGADAFWWAEKADDKSLMEDKKLERYQEDIMAGCLVGLTFLRWQDNETGPQSMKIALAMWNRLVNGCLTWDTVVEKVEDFGMVMKRLGMVVEFFEMKGEIELKVCALKVMVAFRGIEDKVNYDSLVNLQTLLASQYLRLGYSGRAGMALAKALTLINKAPAELSSTTVLQCHLAYSEYFININNLEKAEEHFVTASALVDEDEELTSAKISGARIAKRVKINRIIADAAYGNPNDALAHARRSVRLNQRAWAGLEALSKDKRIPSKTDSIVESMAALSTADSQKHKTPSTTFTTFASPLLWPLVSALHAAYIQASNIYRHQGMVREAEYYLDQALKTVEAVRATPRVAKTMTMYGDLKVRAGFVEEGEEMLASARKLISSGSVDFEVAAGNLERIKGDWMEESKAYERAEEHLEQLMAIDRIEGLGNFPTDPENLVESMAKMALEEAASKPKPKVKALAKPRARGRAATTKVKAAKVEAEKATPSANATSIAAGECSALLKQKGNVLRLKAHNLSMQHKCDQAEALLEEAAKLPVGHQEAVVHGLTEARHLFLEALALIGSDPIFSVLQDSTISLPNIAMAKSGTLSPTTSPVKKTARKPTKERKAVREFMELLSRARNAVYNVHTRAAQCGSSTMTHSVASLLSEIIVLIHAVTSTKGKGPEHPLFASYSLELHKGLSLQREKAAIETEKLADSVPEDLSWPTNGPHCGPVPTELSPFDFSSFQRDYIDIIPTRWAAVSISLNEKRDELYVSRFQAGQNQLMIRLPLTRQNERDGFELFEYEYEDGLQELNDIIEGANSSAHRAKEMTSKGSRKEWWEEREALDVRLKDLLENLEHVWLGGFRGIFCQYPRHAGLLAIFKSTFDKILARYLPSRKRKKSGKVNIDHRILEFFTGLGPSEGQENFSEELTDLIYFVVDILQFHGEGNAYDEIDVDEMIVELTDALDTYHQDVAFRTSEAEQEIDHTILILDKSVHMFPWESLPCLRGHSVSRLPSLAALRERILIMQEKTPSQALPGFYINKGKGSYILNPSSDLVSTQKMFEVDFKKLKEWEGIVNRVPSEEEFRKILKHRELLIYFGHGSGAHYIRARTVRKLDRCAVSMLLGCSSGALKDAGEFEPHGMSINYLLGGCPSLVATLWDVTDKDIDRFAKDVFDRWGLFDEKSSKKGKGNASSSPAAGVSLVEAVAKGRECCVLKYLNGAAPVVYGIPAYLSV